MKIIIACILSFAVSAITGKFLVPELRKLKAGQSIREDGPTWHAGKAGTPTMGGLMFILGIFVSILICGWKGMMAGDFKHLYIFFFALIFGGIGFLDDFEKVKHKQNLGLTAIQKFLLQLAAAVAFLCLMRFEGMLTPNLYVPFFNTQIVMSWWVYMVFAAFVIVGTVNAVNITDGIDGLAGSVTVPVGLFSPCSPSGGRAMSSSAFMLRRSSGEFSASSSIISTPLRSSWATQARCSSAARWRRWPLPTICRLC